MTSIESPKHDTTISKRLLMWDISPSLADTLFSWSNIVLIVGAAAVLIGTIGAITFSAVRERFADIRISDNERATAVANKAASEAQLELARLKAPRSLSEEQVARIRQKVVTFKQQPFGVITYWNLDEPSSFAKRIGDDALIKAGWSFVKAERFEALIGVVTGVEVQISDDADERFKRAASALVKALTDEGIDARLKSEPAYKSLIKLQIGMKS